MEKLFLYNLDFFLILKSVLGVGLQVPQGNPTIVGILWALAPKVGVEKSTSV